MVNKLNAQQVLGRWVIPTINNYYEDLAPSLLTFDENSGIIHSELQSIPPDLTDHRTISAGAYSYGNYNVDFYVIDRYICYGTADPIVYTSSNNIPENQIIKRPGYDNEYYLFSEISASNHDKSLLYTHVTVTNGIPTIQSTIEIISGIQNEFIGFAITEEIGGVRNLYVASPRGETGDEPSGLRKWQISSSGVDLNSETYIISSNNTSLLEKDFDAYNLEHIIANNGYGDIDIIAWSHGRYSTTEDWKILDQIVVVTDDGSNNPDVKVIDLNDDPQSGDNDYRIGGIEFSDIENNMLYVSTTNGGIIKIDYVNYQIPADIITVPGAPLDNFGRTFLQTAPDGHIYGVSNDGTILGRILQTGANAGTFYSDNVFEFPEGAVSTYYEFDNKNYYILPENQRVHNFMTPTVEVTPTCPGQSTGTATITIEGGFVPYTLQLQIDVNGNWVDQGDPVTTSDPEYTFENLAYGSHNCVITDNHNNVTNIEFMIEYVDFDVEDMYEVNSTTPETWSNIVNQSYLWGIRIKDNTSLTIENSTLEFSSLAKIIIEPGSELILDNSTLTNYEDCYDPWIGIEVWGDSEEHQYGYPTNPLAQGRLYIKNGSYIKNAVSAVELWNPGYIGSTGGIVQANNAHFINNAKSIHGLNYINYDPFLDPFEREVDNVSYFINCTFEVNSNYLPSQRMFYKHIDIASVRGFNFEGCDFVLSTTGVNISDWNNGIAAYDAGFSVEPYAFVNDNCSFTGFYNGISALGDLTSNRTFKVDGASFVNNNVGIYASAESDAVIVNSDFDIGPNIWAKSVCGDLTSGFGIDFLGCTNFIIENNKFDKYEFGPDDTYTGIRVVSCPSPHDIIYKNTFTGLSYGNYAEGNNREDFNDDKKGIEYRCNINTSNWVDLKVDFIEYDWDGRIKGTMGDPDLSAANRFTQEEDDNDKHVINRGTQDITFMHWQYDPQELIPTKNIGQVIASNNNLQVDQNTCPDNYGGNGGAIILSASARITKELEFSNNLADYNSVLSLYESLEDGGNTTSELLDIETAIPDDMWELRNKLLGDSPHLSQEVLMAMSDRTDVLPDDAIFDILAANPEELKEDTLISYLENKEDPLPDYMINILKQLAYTNTTYKTILLYDMDYYYGQKMQAAKSIVHSIISDSIIDQEDYRNWLDNMSCLSADKQIIASYLSENDTTSAIQLLNILHSIYDLEGDELDDYNNYKDLLLMQLTWKNQGKTIFDLDSNDIAILENYAYNTSGGASNSSRNILTAAYNYNFCDCLRNNDTTYTKSLGAVVAHVNRNIGIDIMANPNPAKIWTAFDYKLFSDESVGLITVSDINGKEITRFNISGKQGQEVWDTRNVKPGVYIYTISSLGSTKSGKLVIQ